jgi:hypothetical protein
LIFTGENENYSTPNNKQGEEYWFKHSKIPTCHIVITSWYYSIESKWQSQAPEPVKYEMNVIIKLELFLTGRLIGPARIE